MTPDVRVLFIGGFGRSGSTLIERILGQLPGYVAVGELVHLPQRGLVEDEPCGCGKAFSDCPFWTEIGQRAFGGWDQVHGWRELQLQVDRKRFLPELLVPARRRFRHALHRHANRLGTLYRAVAEVAGADVVVDSSKHIQTAVLLRHVPGVRPVVLHLVRDSRGVASSWSRSVARPEANGKLMVRYGPWSAAAQYVQYNLLFHLLGLGRTRRVFLRYEDFLSDPVGQLRRVLREADLARPTDDDLAFLGPDAVELEADHSVAGNPMRFATGRVVLRRDDRWRTDLPTRQRRIVTAVTAPLLHHYHYRTRPA